MIVNKEGMQEAEYLILIVQGGVGRNIMATAVLRNLKKAYPDKKIIVLCGCPDVFLKTPYAERVYNLGQPLFIFDEYIRKKKSIVIDIEPYRYFDYVYHRKHFVECWCEMMDIPCDSTYPEIFFTENEKKMAEIQMKQYGKKMILIQGEGGKDPKDKSEKEHIITASSMYRRNLPKDTIKALTDKLVVAGYAVGIVATPNQYLPGPAERINFPIRSIIALIPHAEGIICIDSFLMHGTAIFQKPSVVVWGGTNPKVLGYDFNINMTREVCDDPMCHRPNSYMFDIESTGFMWDCPNNDKCMNYGADEILGALKKIGGKNGLDTEPHHVDSRPEEKEGGSAEGRGSSQPQVPTDSGADRINQRYA